MKGKLLKEKFRNTNFDTLNVQNLVKGIYIIKIDNSFGRFIVNQAKITSKLVQHLPHSRTFLFVDKVESISTSFVVSEYERSRLSVLNTIESKTVFCTKKIKI